MPPTNYQQIVEQLYQQIRNEPNEGESASYIPELTKVNPNAFGIYLHAKSEAPVAVGDWQTPFSIQSISKVFTLSMAYAVFGDAVWKRVGVEPSGSSFNSLVQLETEQGKPRNPFLNAGAIVICDILYSYFANPATDFLHFMHQLTGDDTIRYNDAVAISEREVGYRNIALANFIKSFGNLENEPEVVLDFYFTTCSLEMNCQQLAKAARYLMDKDFRTSEGSDVLNLSKAKRVNAIMQTCGFYDESGEFTFRVGLPGKSGVGGGILALHPDRYTVAVWSPLLNPKGNSYRGMRFLEQLTTEVQASIF